METQPEPPINKSTLIRQLADRLTTVFLVALLCLWLAFTRSEASVPVERVSCLFWLIASIIIFAIVFVWFASKRKKLRWPKLWWVFPFAAAAFVWLMYLILRIPFGSNFFYCFADVLLILTGLHLLVLVLIKIGWEMKGKLRKVITWAIRQREFYDPLSILVVFASIFLGWKMLWDTGRRDEWMIPLLIGGMLVFVVVELVYIFTSPSGRNHH